MGYKVKTDSDYMGVTIAELEPHCKVDPGSEDALLTQYIKSATKEAELRLDYPILEKVLIFQFDKLSEVMELTKGVSEIVSITYDIPDGAADQLFESSNYRLIGTHLNSVEITTDDIPDSENVRVEVNAGVAAANISPNIKLAILVLATNNYRKRDNHAKTFSDRVDDLLNLEAMVYYED